MEELPKFYPQSLDRVRRSGDLRDSRGQSVVNDVCDLDLLPLVKDDPTAGGPADSLYNSQRVLRALTSIQGRTERGKRAFLVGFVRDDKVNAGAFDMLAEVESFIQKQGVSQDECVILHRPRGDVIHMG